MSVQIDNDDEFFTSPAFFVLAVAVVVVYSAGYFLICWKCLPRVDARQFFFLAIVWIHVNFSLIYPILILKDSDIDTIVISTVVLHTMIPFFAIALRQRTYLQVPDTQRLEKPALLALIAVYVVVSLLVYAVLQPEVLEMLGLVFVHIVSFRLVRQAWLGWKTDRFEVWRFRTRIGRLVKRNDEWHEVTDQRRMGAGEEDREQEEEEEAVPLRDV